ncbi:uncharacterized protein LOC130630297 [Hydractinia symbiolongicarpus]|uniref:uncharacterized protein LOC130630297 n=1 Tax=Hydractinia symbiolongicarpus TaxID=13093 RepID=UPI00254D3272|nr:uncharacterized protein LOC130630297 [Hydractinia symbiolongicarpus]
MKVSAKPESSKQFKFKGNQIQFEFNQKLAEDLEDVIDLIKEGSVSRSTKHLAGIKLEITKQNKLIKMADRSPAGWATVKEYLSDESARDSDDEKRIKSAESKALAKKESKGKAKVLLPSTFQPYAHPTNVLVATYAKPFPITKICIFKRTISTRTDSKVQDQCASVVARLDTGEKTAQTLSAISKSKKKTIDKCLNFDNNVRDEETYEFCVYKKTAGTRVKGRLKKNLKYWQTISCNTTILKIIKEGYTIPFFTAPQKQTFSNNQSAITSLEFVNEAVQELLDTGLIKVVSSAPHVVNPLSVSTKGGKSRLILDLRYLNQHIYKEKVKFEDWKVVREFLTAQGYMFKFDIKQGYHHIDISEEHQNFLGFSWVIGGKERYFVFTVLPFGLSPAPFICTKTMRVFIRYCRENMIKIAIFIDDGFGTDKNYKKAKQDALFVQKTLQLSGFVENAEKSVWDPKQQLKSVKI